MSGVNECAEPGRGSKRDSINWGFVRRAAKGMRSATGATEDELFSELAIHMLDLCDKGYDPPGALKFARQKAISALHRIKLKETSFAGIPVEQMPKIKHVPRDNDDDELVYEEPEFKPYRLLITQVGMNEINKSMNFDEPIASRFNCNGSGMADVYDAKPYGIFRESEDAYHAKSGAWMTSHNLRLFSESPAAYKRKIDGLDHDKDTAAYAFGRAVHCLCLEPDSFTDRFTVGGPVNPKTGKAFGYDTKRWAAAAAGEKAESGKDLVSTHSMHEASFMLSSIPREYMDLLTGDGTLREVSVRAVISGVMCQGRIDSLCHVSDPPRIADLKTCRDIDFADADAVGYGYFEQLAFYAMLSRLNGRDVPHCGLLVFAEKQPPYRCHAIDVKPERLDRYIEKNLILLDAYSACVERDQWPDEPVET